MNPFLHSTVATPLPPDEIRQHFRRASAALPAGGDDALDEERADSDSVRVECAPEPQDPVPGGEDLPRAPPYARAMPAPARSPSPRLLTRCPGPVPLPHRDSRTWRARARRFAAIALLGIGNCGLAFAQTAQVNANVASAAELESIKGIGPKTARTIVSERQRSGPFESFQDFSERIRGIGPKRAASLRAAGLVIGNASIAAPIAPPSEPDAGGLPVGVLVR